MSIAGLLTLTCTITRRAASTVDAYGDETSTETTTTTVCELQQRQRTEQTDPGTIAESTWLLVLPAGTGVAAGDTVTVAGDAYEVIGEPWGARNPRTTSTSHVEATVRRVSGAGD